ncbi:MAG: terpene cyclase/mutase family protein [Planctomycetaceae bacterium]|jgi:hypothetical protein|nr:terpene cyclase/mutase family protein [Planctomycetaceae bacterium]
MNDYKNNSDNNIDKPKINPVAVSDNLSVSLFSISVTENEPKASRNKNSKPPYEPKNIFSDETALWLIKLLKGTKNQSKEIDFDNTLETDNLRNDNSVTSKALRRDPQEALAAVIREKYLPCFGSIFIHACILIILAILFLPVKKQNEILEIIVTTNPVAQNLIEQIAGVENKQETESTITTKIEPVQSKVRSPDTHAISQTPVKHEINLPEQTPIIQSVLNKPVLSIANERDITNRNGFSDGGNSATDATIRAALNWLIKVQNHDGSWDLCGPYRNGAPYNKENKIAATAMALLALQGYGVTPESDEELLANYIQPARNGWRWLLARQDKNGCFFEDKLPSNDRFYTHGLCTIAICEYIAMTGNENLRESAKRAVEYCTHHQSMEGGWRYAADRYTAGSDVSVTGWIVMALMAAEMAKISVAQNVFDNVNKFLDSVAQNGGSQYSYRNAKGETARKSMTAEALFCRELMGWKRTDVRLVRGLKFLVEPENLPTFKEHYNRNAYYWYYASLALHNYGGEIWKKWDNEIKKILAENQEKRGFEAGSWDPNKPVADEWGKQYGRLYTTCMSIYILETSYRYKPIYNE